MANVVLMLPVLALGGLTAVALVSSLRQQRRRPTPRQGSNTGDGGGDSDGPDWFTSSAGNSHSGGGDSGSGDSGSGDSCGGGDGGGGSD